MGLMKIESKLCHVSDNKVIVQVTGWANEHIIGSALAEGTTVEAAEDKAILRLNKRINVKEKNEIKQESVKDDKSNSLLKVELPNSRQFHNEKITQEPNDWSNELTAIDIEIERLNWSREDEINFLERTFGYNNRSKITNYDDIIKYLNLLKKTNIKSNGDLVEKNITNLIKESDNILRDLSWDNTQGREYLQKVFNVSTRMELNEEQLISFVENLKSIRNQYLTH